MTQPAGPLPTDPPAAPDTGTTEPSGTEGAKDWAAEAEKWKALARKHEGNAKANAEAASRLAALEESQKTEQQKLAERADKAEREAAAARAETIRFRVAAAKGVPAELLSGSTEEELTAAADRLIEFRGGNQTAPARPDLRQGAQGGAPSPDANDWLRQLSRRH